MSYSLTLNLPAARSDSDTIEHTCRFAVRIAIIFLVNVDFVFDGVRVVATPDSFPSDLVKQWREEFQG